MMSEPETWLTIATVVRNDAAALQQTLDNVASQSATGVEHLIVDGASTDTTLEIARNRAAADPRVRLASQPDQGIYDAMNKAIPMAKGRYLHFLNAGDVYTDKNTIGWLANRLDQEPTQWLRTPVQFVDAEDQPSRSVQAVDLDAVQFVNGHQPVYHQGAIMTRSLLSELGGFDLSYSIAADYDLLRRALAIGVRPDVSPKVLVLVDDSGVSTQHWPRALREVHQSRRSAGGAATRVHSLGTMAVAMTSVAARRLARRSSEAVLGTGRTRRLRGIDAGESRDESGI
jgi:glycosyltransferase involved in cell wall biosynthesis